MDEPPARAIARIGRMIEEAIDHHEDKMHIPPPERGPLTAIPFPHLKLNDVQTAKVKELLESGATFEEACTAVDMPRSVVERALAEHRPRWRRFLAEREAAS